MARKIAPPLLTVDFIDNGGTRIFNDVPSLRTFIDGESHSAVGIALQQTLGGDPWNRLHEGIQAVSHIETGADDGLQRVEQAFLNAFGRTDGKSIPLSDSPIGQMVEKVRDKHGAPAAAAALAYHTGQLGNVTLNSESLSGIYYAVALEQGHPPMDPAPYKRQLASIVTQATKQHERFNEESRELLNELADENTARRRRGRKLAFKMAREARADIAALTNAHREAIASIKAVEETYKLQMGLQAPVEYWLTKKRAHATQRGIYQGILIAYAPLALALAWLMLSAVASKVGQASQVGAAAVAYGAMGLLATTALLWAGRIFVRLFMSEHHLAIDAEERATMVHTYLALQLKQQVEPKDLHLVLSAIFRPTADGIVKDDAAPDIGFASLLSKAAAK